MSWKDKPLSIKELDLTLDVSAESVEFLHHIAGILMMHEEINGKHEKSLLKKVKAELSKRETQEPFDELYPHETMHPSLSIELKGKTKNWRKIARNPRSLDWMMDIPALRIKDLCDLSDWLYRMPDSRVHRGSTYRIHLIKRIDAELSRRMNSPSEHIPEPKWRWWEKKWWQWWKKPTETDLKSLYLLMNIEAQATEDLESFLELLYKVPESPYRNKLLAKVELEQSKRMAQI